ncbi:MAG: bifunctional diguanylate cyclase/phosphodiesterase [Gammaproteobacteria bacterium]|nr:bifunctional diguanylate cyclase/phosphodiesterase [Gammaproteobacteria bacterium]
MLQAYFPNIILDGVWLLASGLLIAAVTFFSDKSSSEARLWLFISLSSLILQIICSHLGLAAVYHFENSALIVSGFNAVYAVVSVTSVFALLIALQKLNNDTHSRNWILVGVSTTVLAAILSALVSGNLSEYNSFIGYVASVQFVPEIIAIAMLGLFLFISLNYQASTPTLIQTTTLWLVAGLLVVKLLLMVVRDVALVNLDQTSAILIAHSFGWVLYFAIIVLAIGRITELTEQKALSQAAANTHFSYHDQLTGLLNRNTFIERLEQYTYQRRNNEFKTLLVLVGLDNFKSINDQMSLNDGDAVLKSVANRLVNHCPTASSIARVDGDVFGLVFERIKEQETIELLINRIQAVFNNEFKVERNQTSKVTASIGVSLAPDHGITTETLIKSAEYALYHSKAEGGNRVTSYETWMTEGQERDFRLQSELKAAFSENQFILFFQPVVCVATKQINGFEVLVRWQHPTDGIVPPASFLPHLERLGLMSQLDRVVLEKSIDVAASWFHNHEYDNYLSINLSPILFQDPDLPLRITELLKKHELPARCLQLEILESTAISDIELGVNVINELKDLGVCVALDDFGTGFSSMSYLRQLPVNKIKIDRSFIQVLEEDPCSASIVKAICSLAHGLDKSVVAEGIESLAQFDFVRQFECEEAQGFDLYRPMSESKALEFLLEQAPKSA